MYMTAFVPASNWMHFLSQKLVFLKIDMNKLTWTPKKHLLLSNTINVPVY